MTILLLLILLMTLIRPWLGRPPAYDEEYYAEIERVFAERSRTAEAERNEILARYNPEPLLQASVTDPEIAAVVSLSYSDSSLTSNPPSVADGLIRINHASAVELQRLPGIGPAYAARIVEWREANGSFSDASQLLEIRGIGPRRLEQILPLISLE